MTRTRRWTTLCVLLALGLLSIPPVVQAETLTLRWAHPSPKRGTEVVWMDWFTSELEKRTEGRIKAQVFWAGSLAKITEGAEACKSGLADVAWVTSSYHSGFGTMAKVPYAAGFFSPHPSPVYLTEKWLETNDEVPALRQEYEKTNMVPFIQRWYDVYWNFSNKPIRSLEDYKGAKIRAVGDLQQMGFKAVGAVPIFLPFTEVYGALQKGIIDGVSASPDTANRYKVQEVVKYIIHHDVMGAWAQWCINLNTFNKMSEADRKTFLQLGREASIKIAEINEKERGELLEAFRKAGLEIIEFPEKDQETWAKNPVFDEWTRSYVKEQEEKGLPAKKMIETYLRLIKGQ